MGDCWLPLESVEEVVVGIPELPTTLGCRPVDQIDESMPVNLALLLDPAPNLLGGEEDPAPSS